MQSSNSCRGPNASGFRYGAQAAGPIRAQIELVLTTTPTKLTRINYFSIHDVDQHRNLSYLVL